MHAWSRWAAIGAAIGAIAALLPIVKDGATPSLESVEPLRRLEPREAPEPRGPDLRGFNPLKLEFQDRRVLSQLDGSRSAELTLDPELQRSALAVMRRNQVPEAGAVLMDVRTGELLVYASRVNEGVPFDVNVRAEAPAASVFKLVTGAALIEAGLNAQTEQCYRGGRNSISLRELTPDPKLDRSCANLGMAMGKSINVIFARLAQRHLTPQRLTAMATTFGFGAPLPFDVPTEVASADIPSDPLEFARSAAGFWHTTLSPLAGASLAQTIANDGVTLRPRLVRAVLADGEPEWRAEREPEVVRRALSPATAHELGKMMMQTVSAGSGFRAFHDARGQAYLPRIAVAGKTGTLTRKEGERYYTWFVGYAPAENPEVAVATLVVNTPIWRIKAAELARDVLRAYFAKDGARAVLAP
jgi:cell division protein FtsI/penicillin-binding protein 2